MPRLVENPLDRMPADSPVALTLARLGAKGERGYFQLITENNDTPKQVTDIIKGVTNIVLKVCRCSAHHYTVLFVSAHTLGHEVPCQVVV